MKEDNQAKWWYVLPGVLLVAAVVGELRVASQEQLFALACAEQQAQHNNTTTTATPNSSSRIGIEATAAAAQSAAQLVHGNGTVVPFDCHADAVKHEANKWIQYTQIGFVTGTLFTASGYGVLTDRFGRKLGLAISVIGNLFVIAASTAVAGLHLTNWRSILLGTNILGGLCGGSGTTLMSAFAYVADTHPEEGRANAFTAVEATYGLGGFTMLVVSSFFSNRATGLLTTFVILSGVSVAALCYLLMIPESVPRKMRLKSIKHPHRALNSFASLVAVIRGARHNTPRPFWSVVVLLFTFTLSFFSFMGVYDASIVAFYASPYQWGDRQIGWYSACGSGGRALALLAVPIVGRVAKTERGKLRTIQLMFLGYAVATLSITLTENLSVVCMLSLVTGLTNTVAFGSLRSFFSVGVSSNKQGRVLSALTFIENAVGLLSPLVFNSMLQYTGGKTLFWLIAGMVAVCGVMLSVVTPRPPTTVEIEQSGSDDDDDADYHDDDDDDDDRRPLLLPVPNINADSNTIARAARDVCI